MVGQPCTMGDVQAYVDGLGLLNTANTNAHMGAFLQQQRFITAADMRQLGYATNVDVRRLVIEQMQTFADLRSSMQAWFDQTAEMSSNFDARASAATAEVADSQAKIIEAFQRATSSCKSTSTPRRGTTS